MRIEFVFEKLMRTIELLQQQRTQLAIDLSNELISVYIENNNFVVPLAAFLLIYEGVIFWQNCQKNDKDYYFRNDWDGICHFCVKSNIPITKNMKDIFTDHLLKVNDPFIYWEEQKNELSDIACQILTIPCSESPVERLFGGLSYMYDSYSNKMKDDLIDAKLRIRMATIFNNLEEFDGNFFLKDLNYVSIISNG